MPTKRSFSEMNGGSHEKEVRDRDVRKLISLEAVEASDGDSGSEEDGNESDDSFIDGEDVHAQSESEHRE